MCQMLCEGLGKSKMSEMLCAHKEPMVMGEALPHRERGRGEKEPTRAERQRSRCPIFMH